MPLAGVFLSNEDEVKAINIATQPSRDLGGVDVKSIDVVKLGQLYASMTGKTFTEVLPDFLPEIAVSDDGPWIYQFPAAFRAKLAALSEADLSTTGKQWAQIPEFLLDRVEASRVESILRDFAKLARLSEHNGKQLYLWNSL